MIAQHRKTQLVMVTEAALEKRRSVLARPLGAQRWTVTDVRAAGLQGPREGHGEADRTGELRLIRDAPVADAIARRAIDECAPNFGVALHFSDVRVVRPERI